MTLIYSYKINLHPAMHSLISQSLLLGGDLNT